VTRSLDEMAPDEVLREYFAERRRRESPPSLAGIEPDQPKERKPSSGRYEELILLTMGADRMMLEAMFHASGMWKRATWQCKVVGCYQVVLHEHRDVLGEDGKPLLSQGEPITEPVTTSVSPSDVAEHFGIPLEDVKRRISSVLLQVAENQGRRRGATESWYVEDPAVATWRSWSKGGW
jgi:hypothetical protein